MMSKKCILCDDTKPIDCFYKHPKMSFGVDSKCKECVKKRSKERHHKLMESEEFLQKERQRHKDKYHRLGYGEKQKILNKNKPWCKSQIYKNLKRNMKINKGFELHHWNYNDEYLTDVFILKPRDHKKLHTTLNLDIEKRIFYLSDGSYLDTKEKHEYHIKQLGIEIFTI